jgi:hypothetical protein
MDIGGNAAKPSRTKQFMGREQKVLVAHFPDPKDDSQRYRVYFATADGKTAPDRNVFTGILKSIRFQERLEK